MSKKMKKVAESEEWRKQISETQKKNFEDPEHYEKHVKMIHDTQDKRSKTMSENWKDPMFIIK
jgi:hypothetical protein